MAYERPRTELELSRLKSERNAAIISRYSRTIGRLKEWDMEHDEVEHLSEKLRYKLTGCLHSAQSLISAWRRDTAQSAVDRDWKNATATHEKWVDITAAYFNIIESRCEDYQLVVEDLFNMRISPQPYLRRNLETGECAEVRPEEKIVEMMTRCSSLAEDFFRKKEERDRVIKRYQSEENLRHNRESEIIAKWKESHREYGAIATWMACIEQHTHARVYHLVSLLSTRKAFRDEELREAESAASRGEERITRIITEFAGYASRIEEEERARREAEAAAEREREEKERLEREERERQEQAERERLAEEKRRKEQEALAEEQKAEVAAMLPELQAKFNTPRKSKETEKKTITKKEKEMTKAKEQIRKEVKAQPAPEESLVITTDDSELEGLVIDTFDVSRANCCCVQAGRVIFSRQLSRVLIDKGYTRFSAMEQNGSVYLLFRRSRGVELDLEEEGETYYCTAAAEKDAALITAKAGGDSQYQEYGIQAGINQKHDYMYAKITGKA